MTQDEARTGISMEWQKLKPVHKADDARVTAFCYRMAEEYNFRCAGNRVEVVRGWVIRQKTSEAVARPRGGLPKA